MRLFIILILCFNFMFATLPSDENKTIPNITLSKKIKEHNNSVVISIKQIIFKSINSIMPSYLQVAPKENFLDLKFVYDPLENQFKTRVKVNFILPSFEKSIKKIKISSKKTTTKTFTFKITPFFSIYKSAPTLVIKPSFTYSKSIENLISLFTKSFYFNETIYYYSFQNEFKEVTSIILNKVITIKNLSFKASKTIYSDDISKIYYSLGFYYYSKAIKNVRVYGFSVSGNSHKQPFIQNYKLFFTYRQKLFNKDFIFLELTPYLMADKEWNYNVKFFTTLMLSLKF